jgi:hypothetical protein
MGGCGSGRCAGHTKKQTVEDCRALDANRWMREGILRQGIMRSGVWAWSNAHTGEKIAAIGFQVDSTDEAAPWVRLHYTVDGQPLDYRIGLRTTRPRYGGVRWWFACPLQVRGEPCNRRVGKLYLPPAGRYFGCRQCHGLTYTSAQQHDQRVDRVFRDPDLVKALLRGKGKPSLLAVKALGKLTHLA